MAINTTASLDRYLEDSDENPEAEADNPIQMTAFPRAHILTPKPAAAHTITLNRFSLYGLIWCSCYCSFHMALVGFKHAYDCITKNGSGIEFFNACATIFVCSISVLINVGFLKFLQKLDFDCTFKFNFASGQQPPPLEHKDDSEDEYSDDDDEETETNVGLCLFGAFSESTCRKYMFTFLCPYFILLAALCLFAFVFLRNCVVEENFWTYFTLYERPKLCNAQLNYRGALSLAAICASSCIGIVWVLLYFRKHPVSVTCELRLGNRNKMSS